MLRLVIFKNIGLLTNRNSLLIKHFFKLFQTCIDNFSNLVLKLAQRLDNFKDDSPHVSTISNSIGFTGSGFYPDCRSLLNYAQDESSKYLQEYREPIFIKKLADTVSINKSNC